MIVQTYKLLHGCLYGGDCRTEGQQPDPGIEQPYIHLPLSTKKVKLQILLATKAHIKRMTSISAY